MQNSILFFESNEGNSHIIVNYEETLRNIINWLTETGATIYIKPHPRIGHSKFLEEYNSVRILPEYIPGEFISYGEFSAIVGISTVAIAKIAHISDISVYSLLDIFKFNDVLQKEIYRKYLIDQSDNKVKFVNNLGNLLVGR